MGKIRSVLTNSLRGRLRHFDAYRSKLHTAVGDGSVLLREYDAVVMRAQHEMVDEGADSVDASEIVKQFHARWFDAKNPSRALEVLAVTRGRAPSTAEAGALGVNTAVLRDSFAAELKVFSEVRGEAARYGGRTAAEQFESAVLAAFREGKDLRDSLAAGGKALAIAELDEIRYLADWRFAGDALRVLRSGTVDANAIKTIEKAIKVRYGPALPLDDVAFLRPSEPGKFLIAYSTSSEEVPLTAERVATLRNRRLVTMSLSASAAAELSSAGIRVAEDVEHLLAFPSGRPGSVRFVFIGSTDLGKAYRLYRQDASDIVSATQAALNAKSAGKDVRVVSTLYELEAELAAARSDKVVPVVFFHNAEQRVAIGDGVTFEEFSARFGHEAVPLTCSSFESPFGFVTTDRLDVGASVYAANAALAKADASGTGLRGFLSGFQEAYEAEMARKYRVRASGVAVLTVVGVAVVLNVAFGDDDDKEKKK